MEPISIILGVGGLVIGGGMAFFFAQPKTKSIEDSARKEAQKTLQNAQRDADKTIEDARRQVKQVQENILRDEERARERIEKMQAQADERIQKREEVLEQKIERSEQVKENYEKGAKELEEKKELLQKSLDEQNTKLAEVAGMSKTDAKKKLMEGIEKEMEEEVNSIIKRKLETAETSADEEASQIIVQSIQRLAPATTAESTISVVKIDSEDVKGRIIGREGRNINAFEMITGVDLIIDDTPNTITISCYDMFRRYVAKIALEELLKDGRIHPSSIETAVQKAQENADKLILDLGKKAADEVGYAGLPDPILKLLGRCRFRTSYGQNVLTHAMEVAYIAEALARELPGADPEIAKKAGLLHDIGKAVSHEVEGGHALIGRDILKKFKIDERVIQAMQSHHEDMPYETIESRILQAADAISASRPGARRENLEKYIKRLKELENIASEFDGVQKVYAIQAGREVRVFVNAKQVNDGKSEKMAFEIARKIEKSCDYPGEVKVSVIRESRFENVAK